MTLSRAGKSAQTPAYVAVTTLFFAWGFITSLIDPLVASVKGIFTLSDLQAQASAFAFFIAYGLMSFPAATLLSRWNSARAILLALTTMTAGCLVMLAAVNLSNYWLVLAGLFTLASGITVLQVAANPLAAALGDPARSHFRLTLSQTFNSLGTFIGPFLGSMLFLKGVEVKHGAQISDAVRAGALAGIDRAYFWICGMIVVLALFFWAVRGLVSSASAAAAPARAGMATMLREAVGAKWALLGAAAIFLYVGAEVSIGTQMALFLNGDDIWNVSLQDAGKYVALYWGGAMVGRAAGSALLMRVDAARLLMAFTAIAFVMCAYIVGVGGTDAGYVALSIGFFNSIMFPVIFTLTLERSSASEAATSGLLVTAIVGGAFVPLVMGAVSGATSYRFALVVPACCYLLICLFAIAAGRASTVRRESFDAAVGGH